MEADSLEAAFFVHRLTELLWNPHNISTGESPVREPV